MVKEPVSLEMSKGNGEESCLGDLVTDEHSPHRAGAVKFMASPPQRGWVSFLAGRNEGFEVGRCAIFRKDELAFCFVGPKQITQTIEELCSGLGTMVGPSTEELDERVASLFQSDAVLPRQYLEADCRKTHLEAEHGLMFAVLEDAVTCFQIHFAARDKIGTRLFGEAEEWIKPWIHP